MQACYLPVTAARYMPDVRHVCPKTLPSTDQIIFLTSPCSEGLQ